MSRSTHRKEVTKQAVLAELESLRRGRHARYRTLVGRFARCRRLQTTAALFAAAVDASARTYNRTPLAAATRLATAGQLMAKLPGSLLPRLPGVPPIHRMVADDRLAVMLAKSLVELDIAVPGDWKRAECDPTSFTRLTLERWIKAHGGSAIRRRFLLVATISDAPCEWAERDESKPNQLFLIVEPSEASCGCVTFGPTLELLEKVHPQLPATFFNLFVGALNRWTRAYDFRDAEERAETLREWAAQEPDADQYEIPDVQASIPACMRQTPLDECELAHFKDKINDPLAMKLVEAALSLDRVSAQAKRPELGDDISQQLSDCNPPLPCLLAVVC